MKLRMRGQYVIIISKFVQSFFIPDYPSSPSGNRYQHKFIDKLRKPNDNRSPARGGISLHIGPFQEFYWHICCTIFSYLLLTLIPDANSLVLCL
jgi:hypothetical protein